MQLYTLQGLIVRETIDGIQVVEQVLVEFQQFVAVVTEVGVHIHPELLADGNDSVGADVEFPTGVAHLTIVAVRDACKTGVRRDAEIRHQHVRCGLRVTLDGQSQAVIEET